MEQVRGLLSPLRSRLSLSSLPSTWKLLAIVFALLNLKSLPFAWHIRLLHGLLRQILTSRTRLTTLPGPRPLFAPVIVSSRSGFLECDYNLHKSNSTYFSDSDVGRLHLLIATVGKGVDRIQSELSQDQSLKGGFGVHLGGVSANFRKEIKPYEKFEVWTRVLCWDGKWLYLVQHFVREDAVRPGKWLLQPWRKVDQRGAMQGQVEGRRNGQAVNGSAVVGGDAEGVKRAPSPHPAIFASVIAKYVFKKGRLTIPPERVLRASELLPPKPEGEGATPPVSMTPTTDSTSNDAAATSAAEKLTPAGAEELIDASLRASGEDADVWDWARVEKERLRGMKIAEVYSKLDALNDEFSGDGAEVLGQY